MSRHSAPHSTVGQFDCSVNQESLMPTERLEEFLDAEGLGSGPVIPKRLTGGHSNVTYLISRGERSFALRRPPLPPLPPSAHDVLREARVLRGLEGSGVPVPRVIATCDDLSVMQAPFYVMEFLEGVVLSAGTPRELGDAPTRCQIARHAVDALAALHRVDWASSAELERLGKPEGYLARQLRRFADLWDRGGTRELPELDAVTDWLQRNLPDAQPATIVHGDFRLGNLMFASHRPVRLLGVLDWEMATVGDPLADLGYLTAHWAQDGTPPTVMSELAPVTREPGFPDSRGLAAQYAEATGRRIYNLVWYEVLALWKAAIFLEQSYRRFLSDKDADTWFEQMGEGVPGLVANACRKAGIAL